MDGEGILQFANETNSEILKQWAYKQTVVGKLDVALTKKQEHVAIAILKSDKLRVPMSIIERAIANEMHDFVYTVFQLGLAEKPLVKPVSVSTTSQQVGPISVTAQCLPTTTPIIESPLGDLPINSPIVMCLTKGIVKLVVNKYVPEHLRSTITDTVMSLIDKDEKPQKNSPADILKNVSPPATPEDKKAEVNIDPRLQFALKHDTITTIEYILSPTELEYLINTDKTLADAYLAWLFTSELVIPNVTVEVYFNILRDRNFRVIDFLDWVGTYLPAGLAILFIHKENFIWLRRLVVYSGVDVSYFDELKRDLMPVETSYYLDVMRGRALREALDNGWYELVPKKMRKRSEFPPGVSSCAAREWRKLLPK